MPHSSMTLKTLSKHGIENESFTILWTSLNGKPLDMINGIGQDYDAAWEYFDPIYGDLRYVADNATINSCRNNRPWQ